MHKPGCLWCLMVLVCAAPALAGPSAPLPPPTGATPDDARIPVGSEFNPAGVNLNLPRPDERYTNNPALNNLIAPPEATAPGMREQEMKEIEEDFRKSADPERDKEMKKKAMEEKRKVKQLLNPRRRAALLPQEDGDAAGADTAAPALRSGFAGDRPQAVGEQEEETEEEAFMSLLAPADPADEEAPQHRPGSAFGAGKGAKGQRYHPPAGPRAGRNAGGAPAVNGAASGKDGAEPQPEPVKPEQAEVEKLFEALSN